MSYLLLQQECMQLAIISIPRQSWVSLLFFKLMSRLCESFRCILMQHIKPNMYLYMYFEIQIFSPYLPKHVQLFQDFFIQVYPLQFNLEGCFCHKDLKNIICINLIQYNEKRIKIHLHCMEWNEKYDQSFGFKKIFFWFFVLIKNCTRVLTKFCRTSNLNLKHIRFTSSGCRDIGNCGNYNLCQNSLKFSVDLT